MTQDQLFLTRKKKKITLTEIANNIKVSVALLSMHESGKQNMGEDNYELYKNYILKEGENVKET